MSSIDAGIASFLNLPKQYTHQIAIPLETNHDLLLELESVQRAILYHCPLLVDACIVPSSTRLPLFWVDASGGKSLDSVEKLMVTKALNEMVDEVVDELINVVPVEDRSTGDETDTGLLDLEEGKGGRNIDGIQPVMMGFQRLEIDGTKNEILHAVGKEGEGTDLIRRVIDALRVKVEGKGWKTYLPEDEPEGKVGKEERMVGNESWGDKWRWRPRVPFMRLPHNFEDTLPPLDEDEENEDGLLNVRMPEEGGNGISPIFWYRWWDDEFAKGVGIRLREIAVYPRTGSGLGGLNAESAFYVPQLKTTLPGGNDMLTASEERDAMYDKARFEAEFNPDEEIRDGAKEYMEIEEQRRREEEETEEDRATLERLYEMEGSSPPPPAAQTEGDSASPSPSKQSSSASGIDDEKIQEIIMQRESMKAKDPTAQKKRDNLPSYKENPIFQNISAMKNKYEADCAKAAQKKQTPLPPYPSEEHFVGAWQLVQSPLGDTNLEGAQENLILRADKTIFGGPILDDEFGHKAAAGSGWNCFASEKGDDDDDRSEDDDRKKSEETKLQIRLVIPPTKERTMVLEGIVTRMVSPRPEDYEFSPSTFKIPELEAVKKASEEASKKRREEEEKGNGGSGGGDGMMSLHVYGEAWMEDGDGLVVNKLGNFALVKLETRNPSEYVYSIPAPTRVQD